jgi:hypothetical protein
MDITNVVSLVLSASALLVSGVFAFRQNLLQKRMNNSPLVLDLLSQLRTTELHENFEIVCRDIGGHDPEKGIVGLPQELRRRVYDICYFLQQIAAMVAIGLVDERRATALFRARTVAAWAAVAPFVRAERLVNPITGPEFMTTLEVFATKAATITPDVGQQILRKYLNRKM